MASSVRSFKGRKAFAVNIATTLFSLFCIWETLFSTSDIPVRLSAFLGFTVIIGYLLYPAGKSSKFTVLDGILAVGGAFSCFYYCFNYSKLVFIITSAGKLNRGVNGWFFYCMLAFFAVLSVAELARRCVGLPMLCVTGALLVYTFASGSSIFKVLYTMFYIPSGLMATPLQVCAKFIVVFIIFGSFLERTGVADFFISLANAMVGRASGGPAKVAVVSSALCGMVSGSSVGNTVTTGSITIPMMKKTGYSASFAAAVEAAASTGGQIMPPIMGAAAFLMSEYVGQPYSKIVLWAILPAVLYFAGIFLSVHLEARKLGLKGIDSKDLPSFSSLVKKTYLLLPLVVLVVLVCTNARSLAYSAVIAIICAIAVCVPSEIRKNDSGKPDLPSSLLNVGKIVSSSLSAGGRSCITVIVACAMAGMISGCITVTGLASKLIGGVVNISSAIPNPVLGLLFALFLTMLSCIVLGMGVPTTANYCIMASTCAPILISLGVPKVAAHFFVFYFGIVADITPPVALAAYAGAAIAKSDPMKTAFKATKLAIAAFIVPYMFCLNPSMLLMDRGVWYAIQVVGTSVFGLFAVSVSLEGFFMEKLSVLWRIVAACGGLCLIFPGTVSDLAGFGLVVLVLILNVIQYTHDNCKKA